jgi:hypothetical protein
MQQALAKATPDRILTGARPLEIVSNPWWAEGTPHATNPSFDAIITALAFNGQAMGIPIALRCLTLKLPCVVMYHAEAIYYGHQGIPRCIRLALETLSKFPIVRVVQITDPPEKAWDAAYTELCRVIWDKWLLAETSQGQAARAFKLMLQS